MQWRVHLLNMVLPISFYRWLFWGTEENHSPNSHQKIWRRNILKTGVLLWVISDIHRVRTNQEEPTDVRNDPQIRQPSLSRMFFKFLDVNLGCHFYSFLRKCHLYVIQSFVTGNFFWDAMILQSGYSLFCQHPRLFLKRGG